MDYCWDEQYCYSNQLSLTLALRVLLSLRERIKVRGRGMKRCRSLTRRARLLDIPGGNEPHGQTFCEFIGKSRRFEVKPRRVGS